MTPFAAIYGSTVGEAITAGLVVVGLVIGFALVLGLVLAALTRTRRFPDRRLVVKLDDVGKMWARQISSQQVCGDRKAA
jgi:hypothetical protein